MTESTAGTPPASDLSRGRGLLGDQFAALTAVELRPTEQGGVYAACRRHIGEVHALLVNSFDKPPTLGDLAFAAAEHLADEHQGPAVCCCPIVAEFDRTDPAEPLTLGDVKPTSVTGRQVVNEACPVHGYIAGALDDAGHLAGIMARLALYLGRPVLEGPGYPLPPNAEIMRRMAHAVRAANEALDGADQECRFHGTTPPDREFGGGCESCAQPARVRAARAALRSCTPAAESTGARG